MMMEKLKDAVWLLIVGGGGIVSIVGTYFGFRFKIRNHETRINRLEEGNESTVRKLSIIEKNLVKIMEKMEIEPVRDLFGE